MLANARRACGRLTLAPLPGRGPARRSSPRRRRPSRAPSFVQESAPEREELKRELLAARRAARPARTPSSPRRPRACGRRGCRPTCRTPSGWPSATRSTRSTCCRSSRCAAASAPRPRRSRAPPRSTGRSACDPLVLRAEIDGFVADRLLEALWREALWLVADDVATVAEIDDAIRFGAGLRWSFMGTLPDLPHRGRRARHAPLPRAVRPGAAAGRGRSSPTSPSSPTSCVEKLVAQSDAQAARPLDPRARAAARRLPGGGDPGAARPALRRRRGARPSTSARCSTRPGRPPPSARPVPAAAAARGARAAGVGRLQRPRAREPLPAGVRRHDRRAAAH